MPLPQFNASDYLAQFLKLLPRGRVWRRGMTLVLHAHLWTLMPIWVRLHGRLNDLIAETFPCSTLELIPEWEDTLGLPDPCTGPLGTLQARQRAVCQKFSARGGQSKAYFISLARALGFEITITEFAPFRVGINRTGDPLYGEAWAHAWRVTSTGSDIFYFRTGQSTTSEPLRSWGNRLLECMLRAAAPAHTVLEFAYV